MDNPKKPESNNWSEWSIYVLKELERLNEELDDLYEKAEEHNASKSDLDQIKKWKLKVESIATFDDIRQMKQNVVDFKTFKTQIITTVVVANTIIGGIIGLIALAIKYWPA